MENRKNNTPAKAKNAGKNSRSTPKDIKRKRYIEPLTVTLLSIIAALVICFAVYAGVKEGWFEITIKTRAKMTMGDWTSIEVAAGDIEVTDDDVDSYIESFRSSYDTSEEETEGTVEDGDTVTITYTGYYDEDGEKGEAFDGGSDEDYELVIGSDTFIDGFEDGLIGEEIGDTVDLFLTFPDDYDEEDLAGVDVIFEVTITSRTVTTEQELTDSFVAEYSEEYWGEQLETIAELEDYVFDYYYTEALHSAILEEVLELADVKSYDSGQYSLFYDASYDTLEYYASLYSYDADTLASYYGYDDADSYCSEEAEYYCKFIMVFDELWEGLGFDSFTDEEIEEAVYDYMVEEGYDEDYTVEEFIDENGDAWYQSFIGIEMRQDTILEELEAYVTITGSETETESSQEEE